MLYFYRYYTKELEGSTNYQVLTYYLKKIIHDPQNYIIIETENINSLQPLPNEKRRL